MADTRVYTEVTSDVLSSLRVLLAKKHVEMPTGDSGDFVVQHGGLVTIELSFSRDDETDELVLEITDKPEYVPEDNVWKVFDKGITDCGGQTV